MPKIPMTEPWVRKVEIGDCTLYQGDCLKIMPTLPAFGVGAVVTDPPYGINHARDRNSQESGWHDYPGGGWDKERPPRQAFDLIRSLAKDIVIWGGNYFTDYLPPSSKWLVWDKGQTDFSLADVELCWTSLPGAARRITCSRAEALGDGKEHATQKPIRVMVWTLKHLPGQRTILDPYMGSGTTGVACVQTGRRFVGIEIDPAYFDIAHRRIRAAVEGDDGFAKMVSVPPSKRIAFGGNGHGRGGQA